MNSLDTTRNGVAQRIVYFFETTTHSRAAPAGIFESCAGIGGLPKLEDADWQQQGQTFTYDFDAEQREHLEGEIRFVVLLIKEIGFFLNELLQAKDILDNNGSVLIVSRNTKTSRATDAYLRHNRTCCGRIRMH